VKLICRIRWISQ